MVDAGGRYFVNFAQESDRPLNFLRNVGAAVIAGYFVGSVYDFFSHQLKLRKENSSHGGLEKKSVSS
ncbi:MAG: hypothetical protein AABY00_03240 [Nanoarchaeota archaeon]